MAFLVPSMGQAQNALVDLFTNMELCCVPRFMMIGQMGIELWQISCNALSFVEIFLLMVAMFLNRSCSLIVELCISVP